MRIQDVAKRILPARVADLARRLVGRPEHAIEAEGEKGKDFYDRTFDADDHWRMHYTEIRETACSQGMRTLRQNALQKVVDGVTTVEEVIRVTMG